jgi:hypothetical protein
MWIGVTRGLAGLKFSGSPNRRGVLVTKDKNSRVVIRAPNVSFDEKYG